MYLTYQGDAGWYKPCMPRPVECCESKAAYHIMIVVYLGGHGSQICILICECLTSL